jgi:hypothetical protein
MGYALYRDLHANLFQIIPIPRGKQASSPGCCGLENWLVETPALKPGKGGFETRPYEITSFSSHSVS